jgi:hypothetical protein
VLEHFVVVGKIRRKAVTDRQQARALRREIGPRCIRAPDNRGHSIKSRFVDTEVMDYGVKDTTPTDMSKFYIFDVVGRGAAAGVQLTGGD